MKINIPESIKKAGHELTLSESEREGMRSTLRGYMEMKPRREPNRVPRRESFFFGFYGRRVIAAGLFISIVFSSAGVSYAAEGALPGDILYKIKVSVNEEVVSAFTTSQEGKAEWEASRAERRLDEAAKLSVSGKLTDAVKADIAERFENHSEKAVAGVEAIEESDTPAALDLAADIEATLSAHEELLTALGEDHEAIAERVRSKVGRAQSLQARAEVSLAFSERTSKAEESVIFTAPATLSIEAAPVSDTNLQALSTNNDAHKDFERKNAAVRMKSTAQKSLSSAKDAYARVSRKLNETEHVRVDAQISEATDDFSDGDAAFNDGDFSSAFRSYQGSFGVSQKLAVFLKAGVRINIDVRRLPLPTASMRTESDDSKNDSNSGDRNRDEKSHGGF